MWYHIFAMKFQDLKVKKLIYILKHTPTLKHWQTKDRQTHIIGIQLRGTMYHDIGGSSITLTENCLFFFNQKDDFRAIVKELGESYTIHFTTWEPVETDSFMVRTQNPQEAIALLEGIERALRPRENREHLAMSGFYRFCHLLQELSAQSYHPADPRIAQSKAYMDLRFKEKDVLAGAAQVSGLSRRRFNGLFHQLYGVTPGRYLTDLRISAAKSLLMAGDVSVRQVAALCGYEDLYYFCKVFKAQTGCTPTQYRKTTP